MLVSIVGRISGRSASNVSSCAFLPTSSGVPIRLTGWSAIGRRVALRGNIGEHDIDPVRLQPGKQFAQRAGADHDLDIVAPDQRLEETDLEVARQRRLRPDPQDLALARIALPQSIEQLIPGLEDRVRVIERDPPRLGQDQRTPAPFEQRVAQPFFQQADLRRDGGLRHVEALRGAGQVTLVRDHVKIAQVMEVQFGHSFF